MKILRLMIGKILLLINYLLNPKRGKRSLEYQKQIENQITNLTLYQLQMCPFCIKVRRHLIRLNLPLKVVDINNNIYRDELLANGGKTQVPCLKVELGPKKSKWLYESDDIIYYLNENFPLKEIYNKQI